MSVAVHAVRASDVAGLQSAVTDALAGGPAVWVTDTGELPEGVPREVGDGVAAIVQTSGSTGSPKRVVLSRAALMASAQATRDAIGEGDWVLAVPTGYVAGLMVVVRSVLDGGRLTVVPSGNFVAVDFCAAVARAAIEGRGRVLSSLVPAQLVRVLDDIEARPTAWAELLPVLRILVGGQALPVAERERAGQLGLSIVRTYGSAETAGGVIYDGRAIGATRVAGFDGVIHVSGPTLADGYWGEPDRTAAAFPVIDGVRWYRTQDAGAVVDGVLTVTGRVDDVIVTGGVKVSLGELETCVREIDSTAVATWFTDATWGQVPAIVSESPLDPDATRRHVEAALSKAHRPYRFVTGPIPLLASGKPDRAAVHDLAEQLTE
ncbi:MAG: AMP-binding protein [Microbacteriaceae bacterium]